MDERVVYSLGRYRIIEIEDRVSDMDDLKGDCYNPSFNADIDAETLKREELEFETMVFQNGVFGYELQKWSPEIGEGWMHIDSCYGFIGRYSDDNKHYIVDEMIETVFKNGGAQC